MAATATNKRTESGSGFDGIPRVAFTIPEFSAHFGKGRHWGYRMVAEKRVRVIDGFGVKMIPAAEVARIVGEEGASK